MRGGRFLDAEGREVQGGGKGYRYFGRARELPGVKEMFEVTREKGEGDERPAAEKRAELRKAVDAAYYGYNLDEEDGELLAYEARVEKENFDRLMAEAELMDTGREAERKRDGEWEEIPDWRVPTVDEVQEELLEREKRRLLDKIG